MKFVNEQPFEYTSNFGTNFKCERCDLKGIIEVRTRYEEIHSLLATEISEMIAYHVLNIHPELNGFSGYDTIRFEFVKN